MYMCMMKHVQYCIHVCLSTFQAQYTRCTIILTHLSESGFIPDDVLVGGKENIESALSYLITQSPPHSWGALVSYLDGSRRPSVKLHHPVRESAVEKDTY